MTSAPSCPSDDTLVAFGHGWLPEDERREVLEHLDRCEVCHEVVVAVARDEPGGRDPITIGRYLVERPIGAGAMGLVFAARDPDLDRRVALKLLHRQLVDPRDGRLEQRLLGEARALAKLAHPNVVAAFEVARHDDELYLAMELVEGPTLTSWLAGDHDWRARLAMLIQAGRGLAAAHAAGIVHRDFKLDNVLVGPDGRARVTDFGLASGSLSGPTPELGSGDLALTMTGALAGTPLFMAPEVLRGEPASPLSDQFSFAVALWTALHNVRPFHGDSIRALIADIEHGEPRGKARIPARLRAHILRGLAGRAAARWPSVEAMLAACEQVAQPRRRWSWAVAAAGVVALVVVGGRGLIAPAKDQRCDPRAGEPWTPQIAERLHQQWRAVVPHRATEVATAVAAAVEDWQTRWRAEHAAACQRDDEVPRRTCLDDQLRQVVSVLDQFALADAAVADGAIDAARRLPDPRSCATASTVDSDPEALALSVRLAHVDAARRVGRFVRARDDAAQIIARAAGKPRLRLRAMMLHAESLYDTGERDQAIAAFHAVIDLATSLRDDRAIAQALVHLVSVHAALGKLDAHAVTARLADAALARAGGDRELSAMLAMGRCRAGWRRPAAEHDRGVVDCTEAARQWRALRGEDAPELAWVENQLGLLSVVADRHAAALEHFQRFEDLSRRSHGDDYVNLDVARVNRATALIKLGRHAEAEPMFRALIARRGWGSALGGYADAVAARGAREEALASYRAAAAWNAAHGYQADRCGNLIAIAELVGQIAELVDATTACTEHPQPGADQRLAALRARLR